MADLTPRESDLSWDHDGCFVVRGVLPVDECESLLDAAYGLLRGDHDDVVIRFEANLPTNLAPEHRVSKLYRIHRHEPFRSLCTSRRLLDHVQPLINSDVDVFLSQVVWKVPGALGQPWHQDASVFPFEPARPVIGAWLALTSAHDANGCLRIVRGSHRGQVLAHSFDGTSPTKGRYLSFVDQRVDDAVSVYVEPGDLVVFDSHLHHTSTDNVTMEARAALTFHFAAAGTTDRTAERFGQSPYHDWMPAFRSAR